MNEWKGKLEPWKNELRRWLNIKYMIHPLKHTYIHTHLLQHIQWRNTNDIHASNTHFRNYVQSLKEYILRWFFLCDYVTYIVICNFKMRAFRSQWPARENEKMKTRKKTHKNPIVLYDFHLQVRCHKLIRE